jgi:DNA-binding transcriptional MerR regulator
MGRAMTAHVLTGGGAVTDGKMTIDELSRESGATTRTIRSYQDRGLLPSPEIIGRTGYYNADHLVRLEMIARLLDQRFSLAAIGALFEAWESGQSLAQILGFVEEMAAPLERERPQRITFDEIAEVFPDGDPSWLDRSVRLGVLGEGHDGEYEVISPRMLAAGAKLVQAGVPAERMLEEGELLREDCDRIAARFVDIFVQYVWQPFIDSGRPASELKKVVDYFAITRPLPVEAMSAMIAQSMQRQFERALAELADGEAREARATRDEDDTIILP